MAVPWWLIAQGAKMGMDYLGGKAQQSKMKDLSKITPHERGLENSIIADELRRKTDKGVMDQITEESGKIAEQNRLAKQQAQGRLDDFNFKRDERLRQIAMQTPTDSDLLLQAGQSAVGVGMDYLGNAEWDKTGGEKDANGNPTGAWKFPSLQTGKVAGSTKGSKKTKYKYAWENPDNLEHFKSFNEEERARYIASLSPLELSHFKQWIKEMGI